MMGSTTRSRSLPRRLAAVLFVLTVAAAAGDAETEEHGPAPEVDARTKSKIIRALRKKS